MINKLSKVLLTGISKLIGPSSEESNEVQNAAYNAMAQLAIVCPLTFNQDVQQVASYFDHLSQSPVELHTSIREALVALAQAFDWRKQPKASDDVEMSPKGEQDRVITANGRFVPNSNQILLLGLLGEKAESKLTIVQNVASVFLTTCFPDYYVPSRYLLLIICGGSQQLREMMTTYLYGVSKKDHLNYGSILSVDNYVEESSVKEPINPFSATNEPKRIVLPNFRDMVEYVATKSERKTATIIDRPGYGKVKLPYNFDTYIEILDYLRICLLFNAGVNTHPGDDKELLKLTSFLKKFVSENSNHEIIRKYNELIRKLIIVRKGITELTCLYDLVNGIPEFVAKENKDLLQTLGSSLKEISEPTRALIAKVYGVLLAYNSDEKELESQVKELLALTNKSLENRHGSILAASNAIHRKLTLTQELQNWQIFKDLVSLLSSLLNDQQSLLQSASIRSISLIGSSSKLPLPEDESIVEESSKMETDQKESVTKFSLLKTLFDLLKSGHTKAKIREDVAHCLGYLAVGDPEFFAKRLLQGFLDLLKLTKDPALHIAMGQALVFIIQGLSSGDRQAEEDSDGNVSDEMLTWFLIELVRKVNEPHAYLKQASAIWLLAIVKNCSKRKPVVDNRQILQLAFTDLLSEDNGRLSLGCHL